MPEADPQDPLPEASFFYRRLATLLVFVACFGIIGWQVPRIATGDVLSLIYALLAFSFLILTYYFAGASTTDIIGLIANFRLRRGDKPKDSE